MDDMQLLEATERYHRGEMTADEKQAFETLRQNSPELDQQVVAHLLFIKQMGEFGDRKAFKSGLNEIHESLKETGEIKEVTAKVKPLGFIIKYRRVIAVAASIAGFTALAISSIVNYVAPKANNSVSGCVV